MVTLKVFDNPVDAHILRTKLESEGIPCYLFDENIIGVNPLLNMAIGGIKLNVSSADLERALEILAESDIATLTDNENEAIQCPECGSTAIDNAYNDSRNLKSILSTMLSFLTFTYPIYVNKSYQCKNCEHSFRLKQKRNTI